MSNGKLTLDTRVSSFVVILVSGILFYFILFEKNKNKNLKLSPL
jgi:hypothetical protein